MPDRVDSGSVTTSTGAETAITFDPPFAAAPRLGLSASGLASGDYYTLTGITRSGFSIRYYDAAKRGVDFDGMLADLNAAAPGTIVLLHACCHNPTGADLSNEQWDQVIDVIRAKGLIAFLDMAYQGFAEGIQPDAIVLDKFAHSGLQFLVSSSRPYLKQNPERL